MLYNKPAFFLSLCSLPLSFSLLPAFLSLPYILSLPLNSLSSASFSYSSYPLYDSIPLSFFLCLSMVFAVLQTGGNEATNDLFDWGPGSLQPPFPCLPLPSLSSLSLTTSTAQASGLRGWRCGH